MKIALIAVLTVVAVAVPPASCWTNLLESQSCMWYPQCLEEKFQCGKAGYPIGYGFKYCSKFSQLNTFPAARLWIEKTTLCLKESLVPKLADSVHLTCNQLKKQAYDTHPQCYYEAGFCKLYHELGAQNSALFLKQLMGIFEAKDFQSISAMKQIEDIVKDCWKIKQHMEKQ